MCNFKDGLIWYIYGAGGLGQEIKDILMDSIRGVNQPSFDVRFLDDNPKMDKHGCVVTTPFVDAKPGSLVTIAVGEPFVRSALAIKCEEKSLILKKIISPKAFVSPSAYIEEGVVVAPFASVQARAKLHRNVAVNTQAIVGHDVVVNASSVVSSQSNLGGSCSIGERTYVGMGSLIKETLAIGSGTIIGMGSTVYSDIPDEVIALGNPARVMKRNDKKQVFK